MAPDPVQSLANLRLERDAILLYDALGEIEKDPQRAAAFHRIAGNERRHAEVWAAKLREAGVEVPPAPTRPRLRVAVIVRLARVFGTRAVSDLVTALEGDEEEIYGGQTATPEIEAIAADEREHAEIWRKLKDPEYHPDRDIAVREKWHRSGRSGTLRAVIFGVSDGLVSNLALVMGVAGASGPAATAGHFILLAGIAGLLAGAFSMAAGEYISMQSQRELFERQIALERAELEAMPEEEEAEMASLYRAKGFRDDEAKAIAHRLFENPEQALEQLIREELGLDPDELGSPLGAAFGSFVAFALGAVVPVIPYVLGGGVVAFGAAIGLSLVALFAVGAGVSLLTGRSVLFSGARQVGIGAAAAIVTYIVGTLIGVSVAG
ncbi:MAG TPA: VIT1/CCC1 transporter family protein [Candidatus Deferrimicrobium sp.]|nr:VIT1/CCC1 transporter family protein [Candidatus Deferrimicrobium sp.]